MSGPASRPGRRVLVLGGTGFLGRRVADVFAAGGDRVVVIARSPGPPGQHHTEPVDLGSVRPRALARLLDHERPDVVVDTTGSSWGLDEEEMATRCRLLSENVLAALARCRTRPRLVHVGTMMEYGPPAADGSAGPPQTVYGSAKLRASAGVLDATAAGHVDGVVLRLANVIGPGLPDSSLLGVAGTALLRGMVSGLPAEVVLWPMRARRDVLHVQDAAEAVVAAAAARDVSGRVVDVGSGRALPVRRLVELLIEISGIDAAIVERPLGARSWRATVDRIEVDPEPARQLLGWSPARTATDAVAAFWDDALLRLADGALRPDRTAGAPPRVGT